MYKNSVIVVIPLFTVRSSESICEHCAVAPFRNQNFRWPTKKCSKRKRKRETQATLALERLKARAQFQRVIRRSPRKLQGSHTVFRNGQLSSRSSQITYLHELNDFGLKLDSFRYIIRIPLNIYCTQLHTLNQVYVKIA